MKFGASPQGEALAGEALREALPTGAGLVDWLGTGPEDVKLFGYMLWDRSSSYKALQGAPDDYRHALDGVALTKLGSGAINTVYKGVHTFEHSGGPAPAVFIKPLNSLDVDKLAMELAPEVSPQLGMGKNPSTCKYAGRARAARGQPGHAGELLQGLRLQGNRVPRQWRRPGDHRHPPSRTTSRSSSTTTIPGSARASPSCNGSTP